MRNFWRTHAVAFLVISIFSWIMTLDYLGHGQKPANFDAIAHITTIQQFAQAMRDGDIIVGWTDAFANYGLPLGLISHQIPSYVGALLTLITADPLFSFHLTYLLSTIIAGVGYYLFSRNFFTEQVSLVVTCIFLLAPYRIINLYIRGALPEYMSGMWVPFALHALYHLHHTKTTRWVWSHTLLTLSAVGMILTHPMLCLIYAPLLLIFIFLYPPRTPKALLVLVCMITLGISAYYLIPLLTETKYLYHGITDSHYAHNQTTTWRTFLDPVWQYTCAYRNDIYGRCHLIKAGVFESALVFSGICLTCAMYYLQRKTLPRVFYFALAIATISLVMSTDWLEPLYTRIRTLGNIQYPWRFLSAYLFAPPLIYGVLVSTCKNERTQTILLFATLIFLCWTRFPQLYGKNYMYVPSSTYSFVKENLHSFMMNTRWSDDSVNYPIRREKATIESGTGTITMRTIRNSSRIYEIEAQTSLLVSDNTFYFPGWRVSIDGTETPIQFQDANYRGVITFTAAPGRHTVRVWYTDTRVRMVSKLITLSTLLCCVLGIFHLRTVNRPHTADIV